MIKNHKTITLEDRISRLEKAIKCEAKKNKVYFINSINAHASKMYAHHTDEKLIKIDLKDKGTLYSEAKSINALFNNICKDLNLPKENTDLLHWIIEDNTISVNFQSLDKSNPVPMTEKDDATLDWNDEKTFVYKVRYKFLIGSKDIDNPEGLSFPTKEIEEFAKKKGFYIV